MKQVDVLVIGGGLTGLAAAFAFHRQQASVCLLECHPSWGGAVQTVSRQGYLVEEGPNTLLLLDLFSELGLTEDLVEAGDEAKKRFLVRDGQMLSVPMSPLDLIQTPLFSTGAKLRLLGEPFRSPCPPDATLATFIRHRLGPEILDQAVQPLISGIYAGDPERLSVRHAFPTLAELEAAGGSLLGGVFKQRKQPKPDKIKRRLVSFRNGLQALPHALAQSLGDACHCSVSLKKIHPKTTAWDVGFEDEAGREQSVLARRLVTAIPAHCLKDLPWTNDWDTCFEPLAELPYSPVSVVALGFSREAVCHPLDGFGVLIPETENLQVLGTLFSSTLFPGRAPEGKVLLTSFIGGRLHPERAEGSDETLVGRVLPVLEKLLGCTGPPEFVHIRRWPRAIPQMEQDHQRFLDSFDSLETRLPGLQILGNFRHGISAPQCLLAGLNAPPATGPDGSEP